jgi:hypothetical protein
MILLGWLVAAVYLALAILHVYWACGGSLGQAVVIPEIPAADKANLPRPAFTPGRTGTLAVACALLLVALMVALHSGIAGLYWQHWSLRLGLYVVAAAMALRAIGEFKLVGFFKSIKGTRFARYDSMLYSPLCLMLAGALLYLASA